MQGVITLRDVVANVGLIVREFGPGCLFRCMVAAVSRQQTTFLEVAFTLRKGAPLAGFDACPLPTPERTMVPPDGWKS